MRHRTDGNQKEIVRALESIGCTVYKLGRPVDLVVGFRRRNFLIDCKIRGGTKTPFQDKFFENWRGQAEIARSADEAIEIVTRQRSG